MENIRFQREFFKKVYFLLIMDDYIYKGHKKYLKLKVKNTNNSQEFSNAKGINCNNLDLSKSLLIGGKTLSNMRGLKWTFY
jgi:hypothetical protein